MEMKTAVKLRPDEVHKTRANILIDLFPSEYVKNKTRYTKP